MSERTTAERFESLRDTLLGEAEAVCARLLDTKSRAGLAGRVSEAVEGVAMREIADYTEAAASAHQAAWLCAQAPLALENQKASLEVHRVILAEQRRKQEAEERRARSWRARDEDEL